jgi:hypothetical protein
MDRAGGDLDHRGELLRVNWRSAGALHLDQPSGGDPDHVEIHVGAGVLGVVEVEQTSPPTTPTLIAATSSRNGVSAQAARSTSQRAGVEQRDRAAGDRWRCGCRRRPGARRSRRGWSTRRAPQVDAGAEAAADQPLDLLRSAAGLAALAGGPLCVARGSMAYSAVTQPARRSPAASRARPPRPRRCRARASPRS